MKLFLFRGPNGLFPCIMIPQSNVKNAEDSQLWFWERDLDDQFYLKSKAYPTQILNLNVKNSLGQVSLHHTPNGGDNQKWKIVDDKIICKYQDMRLDIAMGSGGPGGIGANVGCCKKNDAMNQQWEILISSMHVSEYHTDRF